MELLMKYLKSKGSEFKITTSTGVVCSSENYDELERAKSVATAMFNCGEKYYHKETEMFESNGIMYTVDEYKNVTRYANEIIKAKTDNLTKLPNREQIQEYLSKIKKECVVVMCDIDDFKKVNDMYGHQIGDNAIKLLGELIKKNIGENDFAGRYGGEEFLIVFNTSDVEYVKERMDIFNLVLNQYTSFLQLSLSIGIYKYEPGVEQIDEAIKKADEALYFVKRNGKNASMIYKNMQISKTHH